MKPTLRSFAAVLALLLACAGTLRAQISATWTGPGGDWNDGTNWSTSPTAPNTSSDNATFISATPTTISIDANTSIGAMTFQSGGSAYTFNVSDDFNLFGGIVNNSGQTQTFNLTTGVPGGAMSFHTAGSIGADVVINNDGGRNVQFYDGTSAGSATITATNNSYVVFNGSSNAGTANISATAGNIQFQNSSNAGSAQISVSGSSNEVDFYDSPDAGTAIFTASAGAKIVFFDTPTAGSAAFVINEGGALDVSYLAGSISLGSIAGAGTFSLGSHAVTVGGTGASTSVSGVIANGGTNGGTGASLIKIGSGTLQLYGGSTYTGGTTINAGRLVAGGGYNDHSSLGTGAVTVNSGGILAGDDYIPGLVTINSGGHLEPGDSTQPATGVLRFDGGLTLNGGAVLDFALGGAPDFLTMGTSATLTGPSSGVVTINFINFGDGFTDGTYTLIDWSQGAAPGLQLGDFALGSTISGYDFSLAINGSELDLIATAAIPEPSTYAMLAGLGALGVALIRRRRAGA